MKVLIAVLSCHSLRYFEQAARETWVRDIPEGVDYKFFLGCPSESSDEVSLPVGDGWSDITHKTVAMLKYALEQGYDFCWKFDLDTYVRPAMLTGLEQHDWAGGANSFFSSGGAGYGLSKRAMEIVVAHPIEPGPAEDVNTAHALLSQGIALHHDPRFLFVPGQVIQPDTITCHLSSVKAWDAKATIEDLRAAYNGTFKVPPPMQQLAVRKFRRLR